MKNIVKLAFLLFTATLSAQDCTWFFPMKEGAQQKYTTYNAKDKVTGSYQHDLKEIKENGGEKTAIVGVTSFDKDGVEVYTNDVNLSCKDGVFYIDMKNYMNGQTMGAYESMEVTIDGDYLDMPGNMKAGDKLKDGELTIGISNSGMSIMNMKTIITDRTVETIEDITTEAGTFNCYKITYTLTIKTIMTMTMNVTEWYAKDIGLVKSETYKSNGKLSDKTILTSIK